MSEYRMPPPSEPEGYANYPRATDAPMGGPGSEFYRPPGVYFEAIGDSWTLIRRDIGMWMAVVIVISVASWIISLPFSVAGSFIQNGGEFVNTTGRPTNPGQMIAGLLVQSIGSIFTLPLYVSGSWVALQQIRYGRIEIGEIFTPFRKLLALLGANVLLGCIVGLGLLLLIVPGIYLIGALSLTLLLVVDRDMSPIDAMKASRQAIGSNAWAMFAFLLVAGIVSALGICALCIGVLVTAPFQYLGLALHYNYFFPQQRPAPVDYSMPA